MVLGDRAPHPQRGSGMQRRLAAVAQPCSGPCSEQRTAGEQQREQRDRAGKRGRRVSARRPARRTKCLERRNDDCRDDRQRQQMAAIQAERDSGRDGERGRDQRRYGPDGPETVSRSRPPAASFPLATPCDNSEDLKPCSRSFPPPMPFRAMGDINSNRSERFLGLQPNTSQHFPRTYRRAVGSPHTVAQGDRKIKIQRRR